MKKKHVPLVFCCCARCAYYDYTDDLSSLAGRTAMFLSLKSKKGKPTHAIKSPFVQFNLAEIILCSCTALIMFHNADPSYHHNLIRRM